MTPLPHDSLGAEESRVFSAKPWIFFFCLFMMRLINLLYPRNRCYTAGWVKRRSVLSYCTATPPTPPFFRKSQGPWRTFHESQGFANDLLLSGHGEAVSPSSFHILLSLLAAGSYGWSRNHFLQFFKVDSLGKLESSVSLLQDIFLADRPDDGPRIRCSTSLWHDHSFSLHPLFLHSLHHPHRASIFPVDFHKTPLVRQQINSRVEHDTSGLIKHLISEECLSNSSPVKLVVTNTLHFKGDWDISDDMQNPNNCSSYDYQLDYDFAERFVGAEIITVGRNIFVEGDDVTCVMFGNKFRRPSKDKCYVNLSCRYPAPARYTSSYSIPNETLMEVAGREIPKFNVSSEVDPSTMLRGQGIVLPFSAGWLSSMLAPPHSYLGGELYLFKMLQKTFIDLNEHGSEAATATTAIVMSGCPSHLPMPSFIVDKCYGSNLFDDTDGSMATIGLQVLQHV